MALGTGREEGRATPRDRQRATLESGPCLDLARLIPRGAGRPGTHIHCILTCGSGETITAELVLRHGSGDLRLSFEGRHQRVLLFPSRRHFGGQQWYAECPRSQRRARVLYRPLGATFFASRHAWGRSAAYASQFLDPVGLAWRIKHRVKMCLIRDENPDEWDLPPKPKQMRWKTYERLVARLQAADDLLDAGLAHAAARLLRRL
jgi:hypothetical protein